MSRHRASARRLILRRLIDTGNVSHQSELVERLAEAGHKVTQTTVSRDLAELGAVKAVVAEGQEVYRLSAMPRAAEEGLGELARMLREFVVGLDQSLNLAILRTPPGAASAVAAALDDAALAEAVATVAGDDTVMVIGHGLDGGARLVERLETILSS